VRFCNVDYFAASATEFIYDLLLDVNCCDEGAEMTESSADDLPKKTNIYALRKVTLPRDLSYHGCLHCLVTFVKTS